MDRPFLLRLVAGFLGIAAAALGGFAVFIGGALQALDSGPKIPSEVSVFAPLVIVTSAIAAAAVSRARGRLAAALYALAALVLAGPLWALQLRPALWALPIALVAAAALAFVAAGPTRRR